VKPLIGLTGRRGRGNVLGAPPAFEDSPLEIYMSEYAQSVFRAGGLPVHIPMETDAPAIVKRLDALVFSGGEDVEPLRYGQAVEEHSGPFSPERDAAELALYVAALARGIPILGICRGAQLINVAQGGTLIQHLDAVNGMSHNDFDVPRSRRSHVVTLKPGSVVHSIYGDTVRVNSYHHQAVSELGVDVVSTGSTIDGVVESIELARRPVIAVQWHPECFATDPIFRWLVEESARLMITREDHTV
jgi:putative glutamine amidotransferase